MRKLLIAIFLFSSLVASASKKYVRIGGSDAANGLTVGTAWLTISFATANAVSGDTIDVGAGTFTVAVQCNVAAGVSIIGVDTTNTIINSTQTGTWSVLFDMISADGTNANQTIANIKFEGGYVSEASVKTWVCFWITGRSNVKIHHCRFNGFKQTAGIFNGINTDNPGTDVGFTKATGNEFYNNVVTNCAAMYAGTGQGAIMLGFQNGMLIHDNIIDQTQRVNFANGWPIKYWNQCWLDGVKIYNNTLTKIPYSGTYPGENGNWDFCIEFFSYSGLEIYNNNIQGAIDLNYGYRKNYGYSAWIHDNNLTHAVQGTKVEGAVIFEYRTESAIVERNVINNKTYGITFNTRGVAENGDDRDNIIGGNVPGGYSYIDSCIIRNNYMYNFYNGTGTGNRFFIGVISEGTDDPQINRFYVYNNTMIADLTDPINTGIDLSSMPNGDGDSIFIRNNIVKSLDGSWIRGSVGNTNIDTAIITHNNIYLCGNSNNPEWPAGNPSPVYTVNNNTLGSSPNLDGSGHPNVGSIVIDAGTNVGIAFNGTAPDQGFFETGGASNIDPVANAGADSVVVYPRTTCNVLGSGTDSDGTIVSYSWTQISGPSLATIGSPSSQNTLISVLVPGTYVFQLTVTDDDSATDTDTVTIIVNGDITNTNIIRTLLRIL